MQSLDVISVNIWSIVISLINLVLLFLIIKRFLFKPVKKVMQKRREEIESRYAAAEDAQKKAEENEARWSEKMEGAQEEADAILKDAADAARFRGDKIVSEAQERADGILRSAKTEAELEVQKAQAGIKDEIVTVSSALVEKLLEREVNEKDHRELIDSFLSEIGERHG